MFPSSSFNRDGLTGDLRSSFFRSLELVGTVLNTSDAATELREYVEDLIHDLDERVSRIKAKPHGYVGYLGRGKHGLTFTQPSYVPFTLGGVHSRLRTMRRG